MSNFVCIDEEMHVEPGGACLFFIPGVGIPGYACGKSRPP